MKTMQAQLPKPPIPAGVDLHDFSFTPVFRLQLFRSTFHAQASDAEWRAGVTLWLRSWDQIPAGSLPDNDVELCRLAELGRDQRTWKRLKQMALHGWYICSDSRLYHRVVAEGVMAAFVRRKAAAEKGKIGASRRWTLIDGGKSDSTGIAPAIKKDSTGNGAGTEMLMPGDGNLTLDIRDPNPLPPFEKGVSRRRSESRTEKDEANAAWLALITSKGAKRDARVQHAIDAVGGWLSIAQRENGAGANIVRKKFCDAFRDYSP
jgi:hypothetical protein